MHQFRVTKYNPAHRNSRGHYQREEWTSHADIGRTFGGVTLTQAAYDMVEDGYVGAALGFLDEAGITSLNVRDLETAGVTEAVPAEGAALDRAGLSDALRQVLREAYWCRFEADGAFIHLGYDCYMYIGVPSGCPGAQSAARVLGLFVEPFVSPYHRQN
jgi:hypothetical protein